MGLYEEWRTRAQCRIEGVSVDEFFPYRGESQAKAKQVCSRCSVRAECDEFRRKHNEEGIWSGEIHER